MHETIDLLFLETIWKIMCERVLSMACQTEHIFKAKFMANKRQSHWHNCVNFFLKTRKTNTLLIMSGKITHFSLVIYFFLLHAIIYYSNYQPFLLLYFPFKTYHEFLFVWFFFHLWKRIKISHFACSNIP